MHNGIKWSREEINLLYQGYKKGSSLDKVLLKINQLLGYKDNNYIREEYGTILELWKLRRLNKNKWGIVFKFYWDQYYAKNRNRLIKKAKQYSEKHKEERLSYSIDYKKRKKKKIREYNHGYYINIIKPARQISLTPGEFRNLESRVG